MTNTENIEKNGDRTLKEIKKDTKRGIVLLATYILLVAGFASVYLFLHSLTGLDQSLELETRDNLLSSIIETEFAVSTNDVDQERVNAQLAELKTFTAALVPSEAEMARSGGIDTDRVNSLIEKMEKESIKTEPNTEALQIYLENLKNEVVRGKTTESYFWSSGWLKWLEVFFWSIFGTLVYVLWEVQTWLKEEPVGEFRKQTGWYLSTTIRGPFIALLLIFALSSIKLEVASIGIDLTTAPIFGWIFIAGVLGLYSRMAYKELCIIVKAVFPKAWTLAYSGFSIAPSKTEVPFGGILQFKIDPKRDVTWDIFPKDFGSIDSAGSYKAPKKKEEPKGAVAGALVIVRATLKAEPSMVETAEITLREKHQVTGGAEANGADEKEVEPE